MRKLMIMLLLAPVMVFAHGTATEMVGESTVEALKKFSTEENAKIVNTFNGVKSWVAGSTIKVKVYYDKNAKFLDYSCEMMHHGNQEMLMCTKL